MCSVLVSKWAVKATLVALLQSGHLLGAEQRECRTTSRTGPVVNKSVARYSTTVGADQVILFRAIKAIGTGVV